MTEHEMETRLNQMLEEEAPQLWDRIEARLDAKGYASDEETAGTGREVYAAPENPDKKEGFFRRWNRRLFGGGALRTAAVLTCLAVVITAAGSSLFGTGLGSAGRSSSAAYAPAYGSYAKNASADSTPYEAAAEDYDSLDLADEAPLAAGGVSDGGMASGTVATAETRAAGEDTGSDEAGAAGSRKLIRNVSISAETLEFDALIEKIRTQVAQAGGYIESSDISGTAYSNSYYDRRSAYLNLRIPSQKTDAFLAELDGEANIVSRSEGLTDVTLQYVDMESHIKALRAEEEQLLKLMEKAETTEDLITIQSELSSVRYQIESYQSRLNTYDNLIDYDTVSLSVQEVKQVTPTSEPTVWERIRDGLADNTVSLITGIGDFLIWVITMLPVFAVLFVVILAVVGLVRKIRAGRRGKKRGA